MERRIKYLKAVLTMLKTSLVSKQVSVWRNLHERNATFNKHIAGGDSNLIIDY